MARLAGVPEEAASADVRAAYERFDHALGIEAQGFSEGAYCMLPER